ncbi:hypothetical protein NADFUDRAFT_81962 [Nadsonia fulvescens var. elongata DSM 6958]|uniref:Ribosomal RNA-processing protein 42 n=1 Tax=Nadsonia fulvescens var. elongata DSM 6958 TaxID=857566 RepID=A0A1E3PRN9_9ASCO|nr:hypothetical protein NADFUDRAFT_81962 [Nadsonia fulvescens var. elongata DSM 6958]
MKFSPAEISYLRNSLELPSPIRPDGRSSQQYRPLEATTDFLPTANGSARVRTSDGGECIVGVKARVVKAASESSLINIDVDIAGVRDDSSAVVLLSSTLQTAIQASLPENALKLTDVYSFKLFIDALVISQPSNPFNITSLATYLALKSTRLPKLVSATDDAEAAEIPVFDDDWDQSTFLGQDETRQKWSPPIFTVMAVVGNNLFVDPSVEEEFVSDAGILAGWSADGKVIAPIRIIDLGGKRNGGLKSTLIYKAYSLLQSTAPDVIEALNAIGDQDSLSIF